LILSARILKDCAGVNSFEYGDSVKFTKGDSVDVFFVLINSDLDTATEGFIPPGRRYVPAVSATLTCTIENIDDAKTLTRVAVQPYVGDASVWKISFLSTDTVEGTANLRLTLIEGAKTTRGVLRNAFRIQSDSNC
jgi:hypothetical protein